MFGQNTRAVLAFTIAVIVFYVILRRERGEFAREISSILEKTQGSHKPDLSTREPATLKEEPRAKPIFLTWRNTTLWKDSPVKRKMGKKSVTNGVVCSALSAPYDDLVLATNFAPFNTYYTSADDELLKCSGPFDDKPYVTFLAVSRNDDYHNPLIRLQRQIDNIGAFADCYEVKLEYLLVEWNPPKDRPGLAAVLTSASKYLDVRVVTVPREVHQQYRAVTEKELNTTKLSELFEFIGRNFAIRRAKGHFLLSINSDSVFHPNLFRVFKQRRLCASWVYVAHQLDWLYDGALDPMFACGDAWLSHLLIRKYGRLSAGRMCEQRSLLPTLPRADDPVIVGPSRHPHGPSVFGEFFGCAAGDFTLVHRDVVMKVQGSIELGCTCHQDLQLFLSSAGVLEGRTAEFMYVHFHVYHTTNTYARVIIPFADMFHNRRPAKFVSPDWGRPSMLLEEHGVLSGNRSKCPPDGEKIVSIACHERSKFTKLGGENYCYASVMAPGLSAEICEFAGIVDTEDDCAQLCRVSGGCNAYVWHDLSARDFARNCYHRVDGNIEPYVTQSGIKSGYCEP